MRRTRTAAVVLGAAALVAGSLSGASAQSEATGELTTRSVEPGVERVLDDGAGHDLARYAKGGREFQHVAVAPDGSIWLATSTRDRESRKAGSQVWPLGQSATYTRTDGVPRDIRSISFDEGGNLWVFGRHISIFDGETWTKLETAHHATTPDGTVWLMGDPGIEAWDGTEFTKHLGMVWFGGGVSTLPDGTLMAMGHDGIYNYDGSTWAHAPYASGRRAGSADGTLWLIDGERGISALGGGEPQRYLEERRMREVATAPDGSVWVLGDVGKDTTGLYVIRPADVAKLAVAAD